MKTRYAFVALIASIVLFVPLTGAIAQPLAGARSERSDPIEPAKDAKPAAKEGKDGKDAKDDKDKDPKASVTEHEITLDGQVVRYRVTAGLSPLMDDKLKTKARVFSTMYERLSDAKDKDGQAITMAAQDASKRPITYAFNGGPGSSSVWLHMGALGPKRVVLGPEGEMLPQTQLGESAGSWIDFTDLVFIDPVSTGYSRAAEGEDPKQFHGLTEDIQWVAEFIRLHLVKNQRWLSPKFLAGESYGTTRASGLSADLQGRLGINLHGIVLISPVLNFSTISFDGYANDQPYWLFLPTYTATAWHHKKLAAPLDASLKGAIEQATAWAQTEYVQALAMGDALPEGKRNEVAQKLSSFTGLSVEFVKRANLRITITSFTKELLRDQGKTVGRFDSRYTGIDRNQNGMAPEYDPSYAVVQGAYTAGFNAYVRGELGFESDQNYEILTSAVRPWNFGTAQNRYADVSELLRTAMTQNPNLRVLVCSGHYDLATPELAMTYTITHMGLDASVRGNISQTFYEAGHMMYLREADLKKLREDTKAFYSAGK